MFEDDFITWMIGLRPLEKLKAQHRAKEARTLERLLAKSLNILARVLESKETLVQAGHVAATATSSLEHFLLSTDTTVSANSLYSADDAPGRLLFVYIYGQSASSHHFYVPRHVHS